MFIKSTKFENKPFFFNGLCVFVNLHNSEGHGPGLRRESDPCREYSFSSVCVNLNIKNNRNESK